MEAAVAYDGYQQFHTHYSPEKHLVAALLKRAVEDLALEEKGLLFVDWETPKSRAAQYHQDFGKRTQRKALQTARSWIFSESKNGFSFLWCCGILDLDPEAFRRAINSQVLT